MWSIGRCLAADQVGSPVTFLCRHRSTPYATFIVEIVADLVLMNLVDILPFRNQLLSSPLHRLDSSYTKRAGSLGTSKCHRDPFHHYANIHNASQNACICIRVGPEERQRRLSRTPRTIERKYLNTTISSVQLPSRYSLLASAGHKVTQMRLHRNNK